MLQRSIRHPNPFDLLDHHFHTLECGLSGNPNIPWRVVDHVERYVGRGRKSIAIADGIAERSRTREACGRCGIQNRLAIACDRDRPAASGRLGNCSNSK